MDTDVATDRTPFTDNATPGQAIELHRDEPAAGGLIRPATEHAAADVCIIAEIGVNHDGKVKTAIELVKVAARNGATAVKFQLFHPRQLLSNQARLANYQKTNLDPKRDNAEEMLGKLMLGVDQLRKVKKEAAKAGVAFIVTPFSVEDVDAMKALDVDAVKIASPDAVNIPLLETMAALGKPMIVSTGTCDLEELHFAAELVRNHGAGGCLLHCVSSYPTPVRDASLGAIRAMAERYGLPVGYSDHTTDVTIGALAVAAGACVLEKHFTWSKQAKGPDHAASVEPDGFAWYASLARETARMIGPIRKTMRDVEQDVRDVSRQSICARRDLPAGHILQPEDLTIKRPGTGIAAARLEEVIGMRLTAPVTANDLLFDSDVAREKGVA